MVCCALIDAMRWTIAGTVHVMTPTNSEPTAETPTVEERLRRNALVRHAPVTALFIMIAVCTTSLGFILGQPLTLLVAVAPLSAIIALFFKQVSGR